MIGSGDASVDRPAPTVIRVPARTLMALVVSTLITAAVSGPMYATALDARSDAGEAVAAWVLGH